MTVIAHGRPRRKETILTTASDTTAYRDAFFTFLDRMDNEYRNIIDEWRQSRDRTGQRQTWRVASSAVVKRLFTSFVRHDGLLRHGAAARQVSDIFLTNILRLQVNTEIMQHTSLPMRHIEETYDLPPGFFEGFEDHVVDDRGAWRISDYALDKLVDLGTRLILAQTPEETVLVIDAILNVTHQRSNLPAWFVENGIGTLDYIRSQRLEIST